MGMPLMFYRKARGNYIPTSSSGNSRLGHIFDPQYDGYLQGS